MHIFQHLKTYDKPANKDRQNEQNEPKKETDSWFGAFKGCLFAIILFIGSIVLLYGICDAINSSEFGMNILFYRWGYICDWACRVLSWHPSIFDNMGISW